MFNTLRGSRGRKAFSLAVAAKTKYSAAKHSPASPETEPIGFRGEKKNANGRFLWAAPPRIYFKLYCLYSECIFFGVVFESGQSNWKMLCVPAHFFPVGNAINSPVCGGGGGGSGGMSVTLKSNAHKISFVGYMGVLCFY